MGLIKSKHIFKLNKLTETQIWIPAQGASQRIPDKNFRPFYKNQSLLEIALQKVKKIIKPENIFVSSDSSLAEEICQKLKINFISRDQSLLGNKIKQKDLFNHFLTNTPPSKYVGWVQVTDPLFDDYEDFLSYKPKTDEVYILAADLKKHAFFRGFPINFNFGDWHPVTQEIEPIIIPRWSAFLALRKTFAKYSYHFGKKNSFFISNEEFVDIDYETDFIKAQALYKEKIKTRNVSK